MPLAVEGPHTLFDALQTATDELNIQVCMLGGETYRRNSVVIYMRVLKGHQGLDNEDRRKGLLVEVFATRVRKGSV